MHLLVKRILMLSKCTVQQLKKVGMFIDSTVLGSPLEADQT